MRVSPMDADRVPTERTEVIAAGRIEIDLEDADAAAGFLELVAKVLRQKRRVVLVVE